MRFAISRCVVSAVLLVASIVIWASPGFALRQINAGLEENPQLQKKLAAALQHGETAAPRAASTGLEEEFASATAALDQAVSSNPQNGDQWESFIKFAPRALTAIGAFSGRKDFPSAQFEALHTHWAELAPAVRMLEGTGSRRHLRHWGPARRSLVIGTPNRDEKESLGNFREALLAFRNNEWRRFVRQQPATAAGLEEMGEPVAGTVLRGSEIPSGLKRMGLGNEGSEVWFFRRNVLEPVVLARGGATILPFVGVRLAEVTRDYNATHKWFRVSIHEVNGKKKIAVVRPGGPVPYRATEPWKGRKSGDASTVEVPPDGVYFDQALLSQLEHNQMGVVVYSGQSQADWRYLLVTASGMHVTQFEHGAEAIELRTHPLQSMFESDGIAVDVQGDGVIVRAISGSPVRVSLRRFTDSPFATQWDAVLKDVQAQYGNADYAVGVRLGGNNLADGLVNAAGQVETRSASPGINWRQMPDIQALLGYPSPEDLEKRIQELIPMPQHQLTADQRKVARHIADRIVQETIRRIVTLVRRSGLPLSRFRAVRGSMPAPVKDGHVGVPFAASNVPGFEDYPWAEEIQKGIQAKLRISVQVVVKNDTPSGLDGETAPSGTAAGLERVVYGIWGTGMNDYSDAATMFETGHALVGKADALGLFHYELRDVSRSRPVLAPGEYEIEQRLGGEVLKGRFRQAGFKDESEVTLAAGSQRHPLHHPARTLIGETGAEYGRGRATLLAHHYQQEGFVPHRYVVGSGVAEGLGKGVLNDAGEDLLFASVREAARQELVTQFGVDAGVARQIANTIVRSTMDANREIAAAAHDLAAAGLEEGVDVLLSRAFSGKKEDRIQAIQSLGRFFSGTTVQRRRIVSFDGRDVLPDLSPVTAIGAIAVEKEEVIGSGDINAVDLASASRMRPAVQQVLHLAGWNFWNRGGEGRRDDVSADAQIPPMEKPIIFHSGWPTAHTVNDPVDGSTRTAKGENGGVTVFMVTPEFGRPIPDELRVEYVLYAGRKANFSLKHDPYEVIFQRIAMANRLAPSRYEMWPLNRPHHQAISQAAQSVGQKVRSYQDGSVQAALYLAAAHAQNPTRHIIEAGRVGATEAKLVAAALRNARYPDGSRIWMRARIISENSGYEVEEKISSPDGEHYYEPQIGPGGKKITSTSLANGTKLSLKDIRLLREAGYSQEEIEQIKDGSLEFDLEDLAPAAGSVYFSYITDLMTGVDGDPLYNWGVEARGVHKADGAISADTIAFTAEGIDLIRHTHPDKGLGVLAAQIDEQERVVHFLRRIVADARQDGDIKVAAQEALKTYLPHALGRDFQKLAAAGALGLTAGLEEMDADAAVSAILVDLRNNQFDELVHLSREGSWVRLQAGTGKELSYYDDTQRAAMFQMKDTVRRVVMTTANQPGNSNGKVVRQFEGPNKRTLRILPASLAVGLEEKAQEVVEARAAVSTAEMQAAAAERKGNESLARVAQLDQIAAGNRLNRALTPSTPPDSGPILVENSGLEEARSASVVVVSFDPAAGLPLLRSGIRAFVVVPTLTDARHQIELGVEPEQLIGVLWAGLEEQDYLSVNSRIRNFVTADLAVSGWQQEVVRFALSQLDAQHIVPIYGADSLGAGLEELGVPGATVTRILQLRSDAEAALEQMK